MAKNKRNTPFFEKDSFIVKDVIVLNCFSLDGKKTKTKGASNKQYYLEINCNKLNDKAQIYCCYGPVGGRQTSYWCLYNNYNEAKKEFDKIIKSKKRKGYKEIDVAQRAIGSDEAKKITKSVSFKNVDKKPASGNLHPETSRIISKLMGATQKFVVATLKCPLGQLSNEQIDKGRLCLDEARKTSSKTRIIELTNDFYTLIPHNLGSGYRGKMEHLLLNSKEKIDQKEYDLDTLLDAKAIGATLVSDSVHDQYMSLDTEFKFIEHKNPLFKWLNDLVQKTRAHNHKHLGKIILLNAWDIQRNGEKKIFSNRSEQIAKECGKQIIPDKMRQLVRSRKDVDNVKLFERANVIPLFHGTRSQNITGILKKGMLIRPSGVVITGAMYGNSLYFGLSSKSINYSSIKSSYWAGGKDDRAFLFVVDCALGKQKIAKGAYPYTKRSIYPNHSVWAKGGVSGVINDEMMLYDTNQHNIRYLLEFTCQGGYY